MPVDILNTDVLTVRKAWALTISIIDEFTPGNLALSRAIGDFVFKKNNSLTPEQQIITANPDVTEHQITDDDEFLVLACDGMIS